MAAAGPGASPRTSKKHSGLCELINCINEMKKADITLIGALLYS